MPEPLTFIWDRAGLPEAVCDADEVSRWPEEAFERLSGLGLLRPAEPARFVVCDACGEDHTAEVKVFSREEAGEAWAYLRCPEMGRVRVPLDRLKRWTVDFGRLAAEVARTLDLAGEVEEVVTGRLWVLGKRAVAGRSHSLVLVRGLGWENGENLLAEALWPRGYVADQVCVLVPDQAVPALGANDDLRIIPLARVLSLGGSGLTADPSTLGVGVARKRSRGAAVSASFPTPRGARLEDVELSVAERSLRVTVGGTRREYTFTEAGFEDGRRKGMPNQSWTLLGILAGQNGTFPADRGTVSRGTTPLKQSVNKLNDALRALLNVREQPVRFRKNPPRYEARFRIRSERIQRLPVPPGTSWDAVSICETAEGMITISVDGLEVHPEFVVGEDGPTATWEAAQGSETRTWTYPLRALGLADPDGTIALDGEALLQVLRANGRVNRGRSDRHMLDLTRRLIRLFDNDDPPFQFVPSQKLWSAKFEASSQVKSAAGNR